MEEIRLGSPLRGQWMQADKTRRYYINQLFGENHVSFYKDAGMLGHNGIDYHTLSFVEGHAPIFATHDGYVISDKTIQSDTMGRYVNIMSNKLLINGRPAKARSISFHLSRVDVSINNKQASTWFGSWFAKHNNFIKQGQQIGLGGNTGQFTTGPHLHYGLYPYWERPNGTFQMDTTNGYRGAIDPMQFFEDNKVYQYGTSNYNRKWYYNGVKISREEVNKLIPNNR